MRTDDLWRCEEERVNYLKSMVIKNKEFTNCGSQLVDMLEEFNNNNTKTAVFEDTTVEHDNDSAILRMGKNGNIVYKYKHNDLLPDVWNGTMVHYVIELADWHLEKNKKTYHGMSNNITLLCVFGKSADKRHRYFDWWKERQSKKGITVYG